MFHSLTSSSGWLSLITLVVMEIILGIDNIIFISIIANKLQGKTRNRARIYGLAIAMLVRIVLLFGIAVIISLTKPLFEFLGNEISGKDLIMIGGGLFLLYQTTKEIHEKIEGHEHNKNVSAASRFGQAIFQIVMINLVFSIDSILTALGMTEDVGVMMLAVILSMIFMMVFSGPVADYINKHPTMKMLALSFLLMIGILLVADGLEYHIDKRYIYFAMAFSFLVEFLNQRERKSAVKDKDAGR